MRGTSLRMTVHAHLIEYHKVWPLTSAGRKDAQIFAQGKWRRRQNGAEKRRMSLKLYKFYKFVGVGRVKDWAYRQKNLAYDVFLC